MLVVVLGEMYNSTGYTVSDGDSDTWIKIGAATPAVGYEKVAMFYRFATSAGTSYFTVNSDVAAYLGGVSYVFRGVSTSNPVPEYDTREFTLSTRVHTDNGLSSTADGSYFVKGCVTYGAYSQTVETGWTGTKTGSEISQARGCGCIKAAPTAGFEACTINTSGNTWSKNMLIYLQPATGIPFTRDGIAGGDISTIDDIAAANVSDVDGETV